MCDVSQRRNGPTWLDTLDEGELDGVIGSLDGPGSIGVLGLVWSRSRLAIRSLTSGGIGRAYGTSVGGGGAGDGRGYGSLMGRLLGISSYRGRSTVKAVRAA